MPVAIPHIIRACRVCLDQKINEDFISLREDVQFWEKMFQFSFNLCIKLQYGPQLLCGKCAELILDFSECKNYCLKSNEIWNTIYSDSLRCHVEKLKNYKMNNIKQVNKNSSDKSPNTDDICDNRNGTEIKDIDETLINKIGYEINHKNEHNFKTINISKDFLESDIVDVEEDGKAHLEYMQNSKSQDNNSKNYKSIAVLNNSHNVTIHNNQDKNVQLQKHKQKYVSEKVFKNKSCRRIFHRNKTELTKTYKIGKQSNTKIFACGLCKLTSHNEDEINKHISEHFSRNDLQCKLCGYLGADFADMISHRFSHRTGEQKIRLVCYICHKKITSIISMQFHFRSHHLNKPGGACSICHKEFKELRRFKYHLLKHNAAKYTCDYCGLKFFRRCVIIQHLDKHSSNPKKFICHKCGRNFNRKSNMTAHLNTYHVKANLKCTHCNKLFKNQYTLKQHKRQINKKDSIKCKICGKCFAEDRFLKLHVIWHSEEKVNCCEVCGARYKAKSYLKIHMKKHKGELQFECTECHKRFLTNNQLKVHMAVHTGIRRHKCIYCNKSYNDKKRLNEHYLSQHTVKAFNNLINDDNK